MSLARVVNAAKRLGEIEAEYKRIQIQLEEARRELRAATDELESGDEVKQLVVVNGGPARRRPRIPNPGRPPGRLPLGTAKQRVLEIIARDPDRAYDLQEFLDGISNLPPKTVRGTVSRMFQDGELTRPSRGKYVLAKKNEAKE